jgi:hypothetical protein
MYMLHRHATGTIRVNMQQGKCSRRKATWVFGMEAWTFSMDKQYGQAVWTCRLDEQYRQAAWTCNM